MRQMRNTYRIFSGTPEGMGPVEDLGTYRSLIRMELKEVGF
jgi:hypothetical protein